MKHMAPATVGVDVARDPHMWGQTGQERDLPPGSVLRLTSYRAQDPSWDHEHCIFCWRKFVDPDFHEGHRRMLAEDDHTARKGYTDENERSWVCVECMAEFGDGFGWVKADR